VWQKGLRELFDMADQLRKRYSSCCFFIPFFFVWLFVLLFIIISLPFFVLFLSHVYMHPLLLFRMFFLLLFLFLLLLLVFVLVPRGGQNGWRTAPGYLRTRTTSAADQGGGSAQKAAGIFLVHSIFFITCVQTRDFVGMILLVLFCFC
jgi:hypothetical protein